MVLLLFGQEPGCQRQGDGVVTYCRCAVTRAINITAFKPVIIRTDVFHAGTIFP